MAISKETKVGILAAFAITVLIIGYNFLRGENVFENTNRYYAKYDKIEGLFSSNPVIIKGYKVGHVSSVELDNNTLELTVGIKVPEDIKIPHNSTMKIVNNDLIGSKAVEIIFGDDYSRFAKDGDSMIAGQDQGIAQAISEVLTPLTQRVNSVLGNIDTAVEGADLEKTLKDLSYTLSSLKGTAESFKATADKLNNMLDGKDAQITSILTSVSETATGLKGLTPKIDGIVSQIETTSNEINEVEFSQLAIQIKKLTKELAVTTEAINNKDGSLGLLVHDKTLHTKINTAMTNLDKLVKDIEAYPRRYTGVFERQRKKGDKQKAEGTIIQ